MKDKLITILERFRACLAVKALIVGLMFHDQMLSRHFLRYELRLAFFTLETCLSLMFQLMCFVLILAHANFSTKIALMKLRPLCNYSPFFVALRSVCVDLRKVGASVVASIVIPFF